MTFGIIFVNVDRALGEQVVKCTASRFGERDNIHPLIAHSATTVIETFLGRGIAAFFGVAFLISVGAVGAACGWLGGGFDGGIDLEIAGEFVEGGGVFDVDGIVGVEGDVVVGGGGGGSDDVGYNELREEEVTGDYGEQRHGAVGRSEESLGLLADWLAGRATAKLI